MRGEVCSVWRDVLVLSRDVCRMGRTAMSWQGVKDRSAQNPPLRKISAVTASTTPVEASKATCRTRDGEVRG
jgi:hypothetical protein